MYINIFLFNIIFLLFCSISYSEIIKKIEVLGNQRVSKETIKIFSSISEGQNVEKEQINSILKSLYETSFFEDVEINLKNNILTIRVIELPIIQNVFFEGVKSSKIIKLIKSQNVIKEKSSFDKKIIKYEKEKIQNILKDLGYYSSTTNIYIEKLENKVVNITFDINLGKKTKIKKITFIGNKIFKDSKLKRIIASEEYKFWKIISGKKYLNKSLVALDSRLLKNFYLNNGYYNVEINYSFAKLINKDEFELIFNINANEKVLFGEINLNLPPDFNKDNFNILNKIFDDLTGKPYSINSINKILEEIDKITLIDEYKFINASVVEKIEKNSLDLEFNIKETEKKYVDKINIFGNSITNENVIRNQLEFSEGDPFTDILVSKSVNNLKSIGIFKKVDYEILDNQNDDSKIINLNVSEKATGEIFASAGVGTDGSTIGFGIKERNFLGDGINLNTSISVSTNSLKGNFSVINPNYKNSDKSLRFSLEATEIDNYNLFGYKTNKTGFTVGTDYEFLNNLFLGLGTTNFYEKIETNDTASERQQSQEGDYWDSFINLDFDYDKRNQKFQTTDGFRSYYSIDLPIISESNTLQNYYQITHYFDLYEKNTSSLGLYVEAANSLSNDDIKLSERINIPSSKLRGFESGRIGPKDGDDYIGGNYAYSVNFSSTLPYILEESQNVDVLFFVDAANLWGVDYDSSLSDSGSIRSATGIALDWFSPIGPMSFSLAYPITKENGDKTESFRFNLGTSF